MTPLRLITVGGSGEREALVADALAVSQEAEVLLRCADRAEFLAFVRAASLDAVVAVGLPAWFDDRTALAARGRNVRLVAVAADAYEAERLSVAFDTVLPAGASIADVLDAAAGPSQRVSILPAPGKEAGTVVAVWGPKGAPGTTRVAIELATLLARAEARTLLIDADTYGGDVLQLLGVTEDLPTIAWATQRAASGLLNQTILRSHLRRLDSGPVLMPGIARGDLWEDVSLTGWERLISVARKAFAWTVVDTAFCIETSESRAFASEWKAQRNDLACSIVGGADVFVAVCRADPIGIRHFLQAFEAARSLATGRCFVVATRVDRRVRRTVRAILEAETGAQCILVPDLTSALDAAIAAGRALSEGTHRRASTAFVPLTKLVRECAHIEIPQEIAVGT